MSCIFVCVISFKGLSHSTWTFWVHFSKFDHLDHIFNADRYTMIRNIYEKCSCFHARPFLIWIEIFQTLITFLGCGTI